MITPQGQDLLNRMTKAWFANTLESVSVFSSCIEEWTAWPDASEQVAIMDAFDTVVAILENGKGYAVTLPFS